MEDVKVSCGPQMQRRVVEIALGLSPVSTTSLPYDPELVPEFQF